MTQMESFLKVEGSILYPNKKDILTWGPFYFHSQEKATEKMEAVLSDIVNWVNEKDKTLEIKAENIIRPRSGRQIIFSIKAWKDENTLQDCDGIITLDDAFFED